MHPEMSEGKRASESSPSTPPPFEQRLAPWAPFLGRNHIRDDKEGVGIRKFGIGGGNLGSAATLNQVRKAAGRKPVFPELVQKSTSSRPRLSAELSGR